MASLDVIDLSGIGPVIAKRLNELGVFTTADLLRADRSRLADLVDGASVVQVLEWQSVAEFIEVDGLSLVIAEQLLARGVESLDELGSRHLSALRGLVEAMLADGAIATVPSDDELVAWMLDAVKLRHTGTLNGTAVSSGKEPIEGAAVVCDGQQAISDARGRFRLRRLPLGRALLVYLDHPDYVARTVQTEAIAPAGVLRGEQFHLLRKRASSAAARVLSELRGDELPMLSGAPVRLRSIDTPPAEDDLLRVVELLDAGDVRAVSRLFDYDAGVFVVRSYRLKPSVIAGSAEPGEHLRFVEGKWTRIEMTAQEVNRYRRLLRERRFYPTLPDDPTADEFDRAIRDWQEARQAGTRRP